MISTRDNVMKTEEESAPINEESAAAQLENDAPETEALNELQQKIWAVVSFDRCRKNDLTYAEAVAEMERLKAEHVSGLCIITNESAARL